MSNLAYNTLSNQDKDTVKDRVSTLCGSHGLTSHQQVAVAEYISRFEHRTIQQSLMRSVVFPLLREWAKAADEGRYDLRNEATVLFAKKALEDFEGGFPLI